MAAYGEQARDLLPAAGPVQTPLQLPPKAAEKVSKQQNLIPSRAQQKVGSLNQTCSHLHSAAQLTVL